VKPHNHDTNLLQLLNLGFFFVFVDSFVTKFPCFGKKQTTIADDAPTRRTRTRIPQRSDT